MKKMFYYLWNFWPPFLGSGIALRHISDDFLRIEAVLKLRPWTKNYVGTQYGGSMFSLTDAFYFVMLMKHSEGKWIIWDKAASIRFKKPGRTNLSAVFEISHADLFDIRKQLAEKGKTEFVRTVNLTDTNGDVVAEVERVIHIRLKDKYRQ